MTRLLDPLTDFGFKRLFGTEPNKAFLIALLNALLPEGYRIADLEFRNPEWVGKTDLDRKAFFDLFCIGVDGTRFIVELQRARQRYFRDRCLWYSTFPIQEQAIRGREWDFRLAPVIVVAILDFLLDEPAAPEPGDYLHVVQLKNQRGEVFSDKYMQVYLELPRFRKEAGALATEADKWIYFLRNAGNLSGRPAGLSGEMFDDIFEEAKVALLRPEERDEYEGELRRSRDLLNAYRTAKEDGLTAGRAEGRAEGRTEGLAEGMERGAAQKEREVREAVALDTLRAGLGLDTAVKLSRLTVADVRTLASENGIDLGA